jgi:hypothetical protein
MLSWVHFGDLHGDRICSWPEKGIVGTQLGSNRNGGKC